MNEIDWIDLPDDNYIAVLGYETPNVLALDALIKKYNQIPKDRVDTISCRIKKLNRIIERIEDWVSDRIEVIDKKKHLLWIFGIAVRKRNYLDKLQAIYVNNLHENDSLTAFHNSFSGLYDSSKIPVVLNNDRFFSLKLREYWGDFWFESLDPCHRRLTPFLDEWKAVCEKDITAPHFFLWLENQHLPKYIPRVRYLDDDELEKRRVVIKDGLFWEKSDFDWTPANFTDTSKRYLLCISLGGEIFIGEEEEGISHSSFTSGKPVLGAGLLHIQDGRLRSLALESGHYMPTPEIGYQVLKIFEEKGAYLPSDLQIVFFFDRNKYKTEFSAAPLPSLERFKEILETACTLEQRRCHETSAR